MSRRTFLGVGPATLAQQLASAAFASPSAGQERADTEKADKDHSLSDPGPENKPLLDDNPNSNFPPPTDPAGLFRFAFLFKEDLRTNTFPKARPAFSIALRCDCDDFRKR